ncbi:MAG: competence/damage-inducible protein A [Methylococcus sp.]
MTRIIHPRAEIFSQGDEVVTGEIADTNAAWLAGELTRLGFEVSRHTTVGDHLDALVELLREIAERADLCLCTGGLGPTCDDLTAEAVSLAFDRPLELDAEALSQVEAWFSRLGRTMPAVNRKQALLPRGAIRLDNHWGTAPGFAVETGCCRFYFMPGVPREMMPMYRAAIQPGLPALFMLSPRHRVVLRTVGLGESTLQELVNALELPPDMQLGFRTGGAENQVKLTFPADMDTALMETAITGVADAIGEAVYAVVRNGEGPASLVEAVGALLHPKGGRLSLLETVSGGLLASRCGGEDWLAAAHIETAGEALLEGYDVSRAASPTECAARLTESLWSRSMAPDATDAPVGSAVRYALAQWTDSPPNLWRDASHRGELFIAIAGPEGTRVEQRPLTGAWARKRDSAAVFSLDALRRFLAAGTAAARESALG